MLIKQFHALLLKILLMYCISASFMNCIVEKPFCRYTWLCKIHFAQLKDIELERCCVPLCKFWIELIIMEYVTVKKIHTTRKPNAWWVNALAFHLWKPAGFKCRAHRWNTGCLQERSQTGWTLSDHRRELCSFRAGLRHARLRAVWGSSHSGWTENSRIHRRNVK